MFEPSVKHFILGDTTEQVHIRTVIFALFTARYQFIGACHWTPITKVWDILDLCGGHGWIIYHNNRRLLHRNVEVDQGDFFACYERSNSNSVFMDKGFTNQNSSAMTFAWWAFHGRQRSVIKSFIFPRLSFFKILHICMRISLHYPQVHASWTEGICWVELDMVSGEESGSEGEWLAPS